MLPLRLSFTMVPGSAINAVCPYYTMFPLSFPLRVIAGHPLKKGWIVDPFCGRGTTNLAARLSGVATFGMDSSPIAVAIAEAKLCDTTAKRVEQAARRVLDDNTEPSDIPKGLFWKRMYHKDVLREVCRLREALLATAEVMQEKSFANHSRRAAWAADEDRGIAPFKPVSTNVRPQAGLCVTILGGSQSSCAKGRCSGGYTCSVRAIPCGRPRTCHGADTPGRQPCFR